MRTSPKTMIGLRDCTYMNQRMGDLRHSNPCGAPSGRATAWRNRWTSSWTTMADTTLRHVRRYMNPMDLGDGCGHPRAWWTEARKYPKWTSHLTWKPKTWKKKSRDHRSHAEMETAMRSRNNAATRKLRAKRVNTRTAGKRARGPPPLWKLHMRRCSTRNNERTDRNGLCGTRACAKLTRELTMTWVRPETTKEDSNGQRHFWAT